MVYEYDVRATGLGTGFMSYPVRFNMIINYNIEDEIGNGRVYRKARREIERKGFRFAREVSIRKVTK